MLWSTNEVEPSRAQGPLVEDTADSRFCTLRGSRAALPMDFEQTAFPIYPTDIGY